MPFCLRQAASEAQGIDVSAAPVHEAAYVAVGAGGLSNGLPFEKIDRHPPLGALGVTCADAACIALAESRANGSGLKRLALDLMTLDEIEKDIRRVPRHFDHATAEILARGLQHLEALELVEEGHQVPMRRYFAVWMSERSVPFETSVAAVEYTWIFPVSGRNRNV